MRDTRLTGRPLVVGLMVGAVAVLVGACAPMQTEPAHPRVCKDVIRMPCLSGSVCYENGDEGCEICKCLPPPQYEDHWPPIAPGGPTDDHRDGPSASR
jgi:hypothetical protein